MGIDVDLTQTVKAWHFVGEKLRDGHAVPSDGEWLIHEGPVKMCEAGLHAARTPMQALQYAPGAVLCRVEVAGIEDETPNDKLVCRARRIVVRQDLTTLLRAYACDEALRVAHLWDMPAVVREYLENGGVKEGIRAAARAAAGAAAWAAAWAVARDAARAAAWAAARDTAWAVARDAARAAVRDTAWAAATLRFNTKVYQAFGLSDERV